MLITQRTTPDEFITKTGWSIETARQRESFRKAFTFFVSKSGASLGVLNERDSSSPWGPTSGSPRTRLFSWLQAISMDHEVNPNRVLTPTDPRGRPSWIKQFRYPGDPPHARGNWFTWIGSPLDHMGLPLWQNSERFFEIVRPMRCLESTIADAFTGWARKPSRLVSDYRFGGATQLFIYRQGPAAMSLRPVEKTRAPSRHRLQ